MWKVPASDEFVAYLGAVGFTNSVPSYEHEHLGKELTTKNSLAEKVQVDENTFRLMFNVLLEGRTFYYEFSTNDWYVLPDVRQDLLAQK